MAEEIGRNCTHRSSEDMASGSSGEVRNWLKLPPEIMTLIFLKLGVVDTLMSAQWVCSSWQKLTLEPQLWRSLRLPRHWDLFRMEKIVREAVRRSSGQLEEFFIEDFATDELLRYVTSRSMYLRRLGIAYCDRVSDEGLIDMAKRLPLLEEVELRQCPFTTEVVETFGNQCPQLKSFRLDYPGGGKGGDEYALAIAKTMPHLCHLHLLLYRLSKDSLRAILDGCPHLESLDFPQKNDLLKDEDLRKRCVHAGLTKLGLPKDFVDDYEFNFESCGDDYEDEDGSSVDADDDGFSEDSDLQCVYEDYSEKEGQ